MAGAYYSHHSSFSKEAFVTSQMIPWFSYCSFSLSLMTFTRGQTAGQEGGCVYLGLGLFPPLVQDSMHNFNPLSLIGVVCIYVNIAFIKMSRKYISRNGYCTVGIMLRGVGDHKMLVKAVH